MGVVWTSPLVAALGASLSIPLAMIGDMVLHGRHYSLVYIFGSIQVSNDIFFRDRCCHYLYIHYLYQFMK